MPPKRKSGQTDGAAEDVQPRRSTRQRTSTTHAASEPAAPKNAKKPATVKKAPPKATKQKGKQGKQNEGDTPRQQLAPAPSGDGADSKTNGGNAGETPADSAAAGTGTGTGEVKGPGRQYWLMKAEPESRIENGVDVRFSIDDLAAKSEPEPWDGMLLTHLFTRVHVRTDKHLWHRY